jgi:two-component system cell cycle sensor histidine kinase PleC
MFFKSFTVDEVIKAPVEKNIATIASFYEKNVWCKYADLFDERVNKNSAAYKKKSSRLNRLSQTILGILPYQTVSIYTENSERAFTTKEVELVYFDQENDDAPFLKNAMLGVESSTIIQSMGVYLTQNELTKGSFIKIYAPISTANCSSKTKTDYKGALVVLTNVTHALEQVRLFQVAVTFGIIVTFIILYVALSISSRKAERIINKQHEEKLRLEKDKSKAEAQNQQKSMFLANVSHELRTPLNAIIGFSNIIKSEAMGEIGHPQYKEYIDDINSSGIHLLSLINDILDYSKAEAHKLEVECVDINLTKIATSSLRLVEPRAKEAKVKLVSQMPEEHIVMSGDPKRMKQVILNILSNSVKFTPENGEVTIAVEEEKAEGVVKVIISDTGIGISQKDISKALSPFGQIDSSISRRYEGTGLGLPLTKKLTELMAGTFDIKSEEGLGTTITLTFSVVQAPSSEPSEF